MNRNDLIKELAERHDMPEYKAKEICKSVIELIANGLETEERTTLLGLGTFKKIKTAPRKIGNINGEGVIILPARTKIKFDFSPNERTGTI